MSDYIVDETRFVISDEDKTSYFPNPYKLPCGITISEKEDETDKWQLYISEDGKFYILAVVEELFTKWTQSHLLSENDLDWVEVKGKDIYLLFSPTNQKISRLTNVRANGSVRTAHALLSAFSHLRQLDLESNLRDGIYIESHSIILPTYSLVGAVSDRALFENIMRGPNDPENLKAPDGLNDTVSYAYFKNYLKKHSLTVNNNAPIFENGETVDDFMFGSQTRALVTAPLIIKDLFQLFDTTTDSYLLFMNKLWAEALMSSSLISQITLNHVVINSAQYYVIALRKNKMVECMDDRHTGLTKESAMELAQAIRRTRQHLPKSYLIDALYVQEIGMLLPSVFTASDDTNDRELMADCLVKGPFAMAPFMDDINKDLLTVATNI